MEISFSRCIDLYIIFFFLFLYAMIFFLYHIRYFVIVLKILLDFFFVLFNDLYYCLTNTLTRRRNSIS